MCANDSPLCSHALTNKSIDLNRAQRVRVVGAAAPSSIRSRGQEKRTIFGSAVGVVVVVVESDESLGGCRDVCVCVRVCVC